MESSVDMPTIVRLNVGMKSIGEVAARFGLPAHVLRHWEAEGLLTPARHGDRRRYTDADEDRVAAILLAKRAGFALPDIRSMLSAPTAAARHEVMSRHRDALAERIAWAQVAMDMIDGGLSCTYDDVMTCPSFRRLASAARTGSAQAPADEATSCVPARVRAPICTGA
jgi:MerR family transcriptional regulator, copper efflux regulator